MRPLLSPAVPRLAGPALVATTAALLFGAGFAAHAALSTAPAAPAVSDPCGLPAGVTFEALSPRDRGLVAFRQLTCRDLLAGRIAQPAYRAAMAAIDTAWKRPEAPATPVWASSVIGFSSQYTADSWSARQILGAPDVYPAHGDQAQAWASLTADDHDEWIEVGFDQPRPVSAVQIFETYNPGAVAKVELITISGRHIHAFSGGAGARAGATARQTIEVPCTSEPIASVRVELASRAVAGWNELDAIGVVTCE